MKKKLFIYYSLTGNGDAVADYLKNKDFEIRKVEKKRKLPKSFFWMVMTGGFLAGLGVKSKLKDYDKNVEGFEEIVIGSPIWNGRFATPVNTLLNELALNGKLIKFIFYSGSGEGAKAAKRIRKFYPGMESIFLKEPKKYPDELNKIDSIL